MDNNEESVESLKPCPFCGGVPTRKVRNDILIVGCDNCLISFASHVRHGCLADAEWNTRDGKLC
jgi:hypothetical protein